MVFCCLTEKDDELNKITNVNTFVLGFHGHFHFTDLIMKFPEMIRISESLQM